MSNLKLKIDLLPKGAWGNDLSLTLPRKDWDVLRNYCYRQANGKCQICGHETDNLQAHEVWKFNINNREQTLIDIIAICNKCHGVIHYHNSQRLGYAESAKRHFLQVNNVTEDVFNEHLTKALALYERQNTVYHWRIVADLSNFGGNNIELKHAYYPLIINPYTDDEIQDLCRYTGLAPSLSDLQIDNYAGIIKVKCGRTNKIQWFVDDELSVSEFGFTKKFVSAFSVKDLTQSYVSFKLIGNNGEYISKKFLLKNS